MSNMNEMAAKLLEGAEKRIEVCRMYVNQRALVSHQWVVVSSLWNQRGVQSNNSGNGEGNLLIAPFKNGMPTLWVKKDAENIVAELNQQLAGGIESLKMVHHKDWWAAELAQAERDLADTKALIESLKAAA